jgi:putative membrane protein
MISYDPKSWWGLIFKFHRSDTFRRLLPAMGSLAVYNLVVVYLNFVLLTDLFVGTSLVHSLLGFVLSLLLVFRTNTAYERWWEGRRLWGTLVNTSRNVAMKLDAALPSEHPSRPLLAGVISRYALILREHLRDGQLPTTDPAIEHWPNHVASQLFVETNRLYRSGEIDNMQFLAVQPDISMFSEICGACERIKKTPIPYSYSLFIKKFIFVYIVSIPFCFLHPFGYWTALFSVFVFYVLASLELIAEEIENPFGDDANDLPTEQIARTIAANVHEILLHGRHGPRARLHRLFSARRTSNDDGNPATSL